MKGTIGRIAAVGLGLSIVAMPAAAQVPNNPWYVAPKHGMGLSINGDFGKGLNDESGKFTSFGGHATLGLGLVNITAGAASVQDFPVDGSSEIGFGGNALINFLRVPGAPVAVGVFGGVGTISSGGTSLTTFGGGAAIGIAPPMAGASIDFFAAPRFQSSKLEGFDAETGFGASLGANLGLPMGIGVHAAVDWLSIDADGDGSKDSVLGLGAGVHYKFSIPGLGGM